MELEGGIGSKYNGRIMVASVTRYGIVGRHGMLITIVWCTSNHLLSWYNLHIRSLSDTL